MTAKLDENFTSWWRASLSYLRYYSLEPGNNWFPGLSSPGGDRIGAPGGYDAIEQPIHH